MLTCCKRKGVCERMGDRRRSAREKARCSRRMRDGKTGQEEEETGGAR